MDYSIKTLTINLETIVVPTSGGDEACEEGRQVGRGREQRQKRGQEEVRPVGKLFQGCEPRK